MTNWRSDDFEAITKRLRFGRFICLIGWALGTVLLLLPLVWLALLVHFGDEDHAVYAVAVAPIIGMIGYFATMYLIKRWSV